MAGGDTSARVEERLEASGGMFAGSNGGGVVEDWGDRSSAVDANRSGA